MGFVIAELEAGGGVLGICPLPGRFNPYAEDLATVLAWRPDVVLSMTTLPEMARHGAEGDVPGSALICDQSDDVTRSCWDGDHHFMR